MNGKEIKSELNEIGNNGDEMMDSFNNNNNSKLNESQLKYLNNDIRPFYLACLFSMIAGAFQIGIVVHTFAFDPLFYDLGKEFIGGLEMKYVSKWTFFCSLPILFGVIEIIIAIKGCVYAKKELVLREATFIGVKMHLLPDGRLKELLRSIPLHFGSRLLFLFYLMAITLLISIASGVVYAFLKQSDQNLGSGNLPFVSKDAFRDLLDYSGAIFNECCASKGDTNQGFVIQCLPDDTNPYCQTQLSFPSLSTTQACGCYKYGTANVFQERVNYVKKSNMCSLMKDAIITIKDNDSIPGSPLSIRVIIPKKIASIPIVGNKDLYGCGGGYVKGMQYALAKWIAKTLDFYVLCVIVASVSQFIVLVIGFTFSFTADKSTISEEEAKARFDRQRGMTPASSSFDLINSKVTINSSSYESLPLKPIQSSSQIGINDNRISNLDYNIYVDQNVKEVEEDENEPAF